MDVHLLPAFFMLERRFLPTELRIDGKEQPVITGHAAVFNQKSEEMFGFREIVLPGAFSKTIKKADVRALWNHDPNFVLGRNKTDTLKLSEDDTGLKVRIFPPDTIWANDLLESIKRGDVDQMSFGFRTITDQWRKENGEMIRELVEVELFDVSPVTYPAYPQTDVSARELTELRSFYDAKMRDLPSEEPSEEQKAAFLARKRAREVFISSRISEGPPPAPPRGLLERIKSYIPPPDLSLKAILKKSRI